MIRHGLALLIGYVLAAVATTAVSISPALTVWSSLWTYLYILIGWATGYLAIGVIAFVAILIGLAFAAIVGAVSGKH